MSENQNENNEQQREIDGKWVLVFFFLVLAGIIILAELTM
jgi:hypothetical protein